MTKIDIISGFLGAGKTTLIQKLLKEAFGDEKIVLIENEFGEIGIDGGFLKDAGIEVTEMNSGCICCSLVGDFGTALKKVLDTYAPDRILIEPSGVGKLSDVMKAVQDVDSDQLVLNSFTAVVDGIKTKMYMKNFGEFYNNQVEYAKAIVISRTQKMSEEKLESCVEMLREKNPKAAIITTPWDEISGGQILEAIEQKTTFEEELLKEAVCPECGHVHEHDDGECCGHAHNHGHAEHGHTHEHHDEHVHEEHNHSHEDQDHAHGGHEHCHEDHNHVHGGHEHCHEDHNHSHDGHEHCHGDHNHSHDGHEHCHEDHNHSHDGHEHCHGDQDHAHHGHGHHHADDVFTSWGAETPHKFTREEISGLLEKLSQTQEYGTVLRAKGMVAGVEGWIYFDLVPGEYEIRSGEPEYTGRVCVIGTDLKEELLKEVFCV